MVDLVLLAVRSGGGTVTTRCVAVPIGIRTVLRRCVSIAFRVQSIGPCRGQVGGVSEIVRCCLLPVVRTHLTSGRRDLIVDGGLLRIRSRRGLVGCGDRAAPSRLFHPAVCGS